jgi:aspartate/methionine/tyrosine aminotransferase
LADVVISVTRLRPAHVPGLIDLGAGDPDFNQPKFVADAVYKAILKGYTHYSFGGESDLKQAIADYYEKWAKIEDPLRQIIITSGASQGIFQSFAAILNHGDEVILFDPTYGGYSEPIRFFGGKIVRSPVYKNSEGYFRPDIDVLETKITSKTKAVVLCNPDNPTGCVFTEEEIRAIADLARDKGFILISDEIYPEFIWGGRKFISPLNFPGMEDRTIIVSSFSKSLAWTGCRAGFIISGPNLAPYIERVPVGITSVPVPLQKAAVVALKHGKEFIKYMRSQYLKRLEYCVKRMNEMPKVKCVFPEATYYIFPDVSTTDLKSVDFASRLAQEEKVRVVAGSVYGSMGEGHVRLALVKPLEVLADAMDRFERFVKKL